MRRSLWLSLLVAIALAGAVAAFVLLRGTEAPAEERETAHAAI